MVFYHTYITLSGAISCGQSSGSTSSLERPEPHQVQYDCQHQIEHHKHQPEEGQNHKLYGQVVEDNQTLSKTRKESYEKIFENFYQHYLYLEMELSRELEHSIDKQNFRIICCDLYQKSYFKCRDVLIQKVFHNSLMEITELSKEEEEEVEIGRQRSLINAKAAYEYLLIHCENKLNKKFDKVAIANDVLASLSVDDNILKELRKEAEKAVDICWKMLTVSPPMFLCQPKVYNEEWHKCHAGSWHDPPGELICCMYSAGGIVAHKGYVGSKPNTHQSTDKDASSPMPNPDQFLSHTTCSAYGDRNRQEKQLEKMKVTDHHESLHKIKICSSCKNKIQLNEFGKLIFVMEVKYYHQRCFTCCKCNTDKMNADFVVLCDGSIIWCSECARTCHFCKHTLSGKKLLWKSKLACEVCMYQRQKGQDLQLLLIEHTRNPQDISVYHWRHTCNCS
jgi:hypothetical protein